MKSCARLRAACIALLAAGTAPGAAAASAELAGGPVQSRQIIEHAVAMARVHNANRTLAEFAPDGSAFAAVIKRGLLERGVNEYELRVYRREGQGWSARHILSRVTAGNAPAISRVQWVNDHTVAFLDDPGNASAQVTRVDLISLAQTRCTESVTPVVAYGFSGDGATLVYAAAQVVDRSAYERSVLNGMLVQPHESGWTLGRAAASGPDIDFFVRVGLDAPRRLTSISTGSRTTAASFTRWGFLVSISPDARTAVISPRYVSPPPSWTAYVNDDVRLHMRTWRINVPTYSLMRLSDGAVTELPLPAVTYELTRAAWTPDGTRVFLRGYLPPEHPDFSVVDAARGAILELDIASLETTLVHAGDAAIVAVSDNNSIVLAVDDRKRDSDEPHAISLVNRVKRSTGWARQHSRKMPGDIIIDHSVDPAIGGRFIVSLVQSADHPPELAVGDFTSGRSRVISDLNPGLKTLLRGAIRAPGVISHPLGDWPVRLVEPVGYEPGRRYPTVIMNMDRFGSTDAYVLDGPDYRAANPILALASRGIAVLMLGLPRAYRTLPEPQRRVAASDIADRVFDYVVDTLRVADPARIGMSGFSHAGWMTEYGLQRTSRGYAAAMAIDNFTASYFEYVLSNARGTQERYYGGANPYEAEGRALWWEGAVGFNPQRLRTPLLIEAHGYEEGKNLGGWEVYTSMKRFDKPVEHVLYPAAEHVLARVPEQISSAERQVDWFCFWLKNEEDPVPAKNEQYARWRKLREDQRADVEKAGAAVR